MKAYLANFIKHSKIIVVLATALIVIILFSGCAKELNSNSAICNLDDYSLYPKVVEQALPGFTIEQSDNKPYHILDEKDATEAFDTQVIGAIETGIAQYWYPHYLATVVIAIDRDLTDAIVTGWIDLYASKEEVSFINTPGNVQMLTAAMCYGLEGERYSLASTIELLASLNENRLLKINSFDCPIIICYDYQAATLIDNGRNMEIIIPKEGTFTYEKGLLSNKKLNFKGNVDDLLFESNLRLLDGQGDPSLYPDEDAYAPAVRIVDYKHFANATRNVSSLIERNVLRSKIIMSIDNREHLYFALIYIVIVTIWTVSFVRRSMQKGIAYAAFFIGIILNGWTLVRLIKYQIDVMPTLTRYLWYAFYIFQLSLPLVLLWMAWAIDKPEDEIIPPKWWRIMGILIIILIVLVFTNDLHGYVFHLDLSNPDWDIDYSYGFGYYTILFICMVNLVAVFAILMRKSMRNPRKKGFIFPFALFFIFGIYNYKYIIRDPLVYETDITIVTGIFAMLMFESCIRSGLIPVNTKYIDLFTRSPLKMQIINNEKEVILAAASATPLSKSSLDKVLATSPEPVLCDDASLLYANPILGGYAIWNEDVSKLYKLHIEIKESTQMLKEANLILTKEEKLKREVNEKNAKKQLMDQLEGEIAGRLEQMSIMIEQLPNSKNQSKETARIVLLLSYIKRRCNMFFQEKETSTIAANKLIDCLDELSEIARYTNVQIATVNEIRGNFSIRYATIFYDFFYGVADLAIQTDCTYLVEHLRKDEEFITMGFLMSKDMGAYKPDPKLNIAIVAAKGSFVTKDIEDTMGISISFPKGGIAYD